jgi:cytoskeletal protein RodZ
MNIGKTHKARNAIIIIVVVLFILGGGGLFYWYNLTNTPTTNPSDSSKVERTDNTPTIEPSYSSDVENPNSDVRDPAKSPEQYDGQNEAGDTTNANCIDADCSNFKIPEGGN